MIEFMNPETPIITRLGALHDTEPEFDEDGTCRVSREAWEEIRNLAGEAEIELYKAQVKNARPKSEIRLCRLCKHMDDHVKGVWKCRWGGENLDMDPDDCCGFFDRRREP